MYFSALIEIVNRGKSRWKEIHSSITFPCPDIEIRIDGQEVRDAHIDHSAYEPKLVLVTDRRSGKDRREGERE